MVKQIKCWKPGLFLQTTVYWFQSWWRHLLFWKKTNLCNSIYSNVTKRRHWVGAENAAYLRGCHSKKFQISVSAKLQFKVSGIGIFFFVPGILSNSLFSFRKFKQLAFFQGFWGIPFFSSSNFEQIPFLVWGTLNNYPFYF